MPFVTMIQPGAPVAPISIQPDRLTVGDLTVDFAAAQEDAAVEVVIRKSASGFALDGDGAIVAIVRIPAKAYVEQDTGEADPITGQPRIERVAQPLDLNAVSVELWPYA